MEMGSPPSEGGEDGGQGDVDGGAAEDAEHGVAPPAGKAQGDGQGQDVWHRPYRVGQWHAAQAIGEQDHHDAERHAGAEVVNGGAGAQVCQGGEGQGAQGPGDEGRDGDRGDQVGRVGHELCRSFGRRNGPAGGR